MRKILLMIVCLSMAVSAGADKKKKTSTGKTAAKVVEVQKADPVRTVVQTGHLSDIVDIDINAEGSLAATCDKNGRAVLWNVQTGRQIRELSNKNFKQSVQKVYFNSQSNVVVCEGRTETAAFHVFDGKQIGFWQNKLSVKTGSGIFTKYTSTPNPKQEALRVKRCPQTLRCKIDGKSAVITDSQTGRVVARLGSQVDSVAYLATHIYDQQGSKIDGKANPRYWWIGAKRPFKIDLKTGKVVYRLDVPDGTVQRSWRDPKGNLLLWNQRTSTMQRYSFDQGTLIDQTKLPGEGTLHELAMLNDGKTIVYDRNNQIWNYDTKTRKSQQLPYINHKGSLKPYKYYPNDDDAHVTGISALPAKDEYLLTLHGIYAPLRMKLGSTDAVSLSNSRRNILSMKKVADNFYLLMGAGRVSALINNTIHMQYNTNYKTGVPELFGDNCIALGSYDGEISLFDLYTTEPKMTLNPHTAGINDMLQHPFYEMLLSASDDGTIAIYNTLTKELLAYLTSMNGGEDFILRTPDNYYMASAYGTDQVSFVQGIDTYLFDQFDLKYNRPDIVLKRLGLADEQEIEMLYHAYQKRLRRMNMTEEMLAEDFHVPTLTIDNLAQLRQSSARQQTLVVTPNDTRFDLNSVQVWLNGVPVKDIDKPQKGRSLQIPLELASGKNTLQVSCTNDRGTESYRQTVELSVQPSADKPHLWIACVGASQYSDKRFNLSYAAKDASDVCRELQKQCAADYGQVHTLVLTNQQVNPEGLSSIRQFFAGAKRDDSVILFYAGHGMVDKEYDYYLADFDTDFMNLAASAIAYDDFEALLSGIQPLRRLMLIDACHSGTIDKEDAVLASTNLTQKVDGKIAFRQAGMASPQMANLEVQQMNTLISNNFSNLQRGNGATVISSAGGMEVAIEGAQWKNGLFSYTLLQGLRDRKADTNHDGALSVSELQRYCQQMVSQLSGGKQQPTSRIENRQSNFNLKRF